jgi:antirestriction protein ArdC
MSNQEVYEAITRRMIKALEAGTVPWRRPWNVGTGRPMRMSSGDPYRGINVQLLALTAQERGYTSRWWGTYDEIARRSRMEKRTSARGRSYWASPDGTPRGVRKGETGTKIVLSKTVTKNETGPDTGDQAERQVYLLRMWSVFNAEQAEQLPQKYYEQPVAEARDAQEVLDGYLQHGGPKLAYHLATGGKLDAHYNPVADRIMLPRREQFKTSEGFYATAFHEAAHSTGHKSRHARESLTDFSHDRKWGDPQYAREELVAEMGSAMLQATAGIETDYQFDQSAAYVRSWLNALEMDPTLVPQAAAAAQCAVDLITEPQRQAERETGRELEAA